MKKESRFPNTHTTLEGEKLELQKLNKKENEMARKFRKLYKTGMNYLYFEASWDSSIKNLIAENPEQKPVEQMAIYKYLNDLAVRLGIAQRYLVKCEVVKNCGHKHKRRREVGINYITKRLGCNRRLVMNAILSWKLRARKVGIKALIWINDADAFIKKHSKSE